jgi:thiamine-phosphate pyrophosphorylase
VDVALAMDADGVHLGQSDMPYELARKLLPRKIIGVTAHNLKEAIRATKAGADYLGVAPIFATTTKKDAGKPCRTDLIKKIKRVCEIPVVAVGGINLENAKEVVMAGADALSAISAVITKTDVKKDIKKFQNMFKC